MSGLVTVEEARRSVLSSCRPLDAVRVPLADALGLVAARPIFSTETVPPFANSSMDGYALRARDVAAGPAKLRVVGQLMAGDDPGALVVGEGEAVRIMTGAALPDGADAVCMIEHTRPRDGWVLIEEAVGPGTNVRRPGDDIAAGEEVFAAGESLGPAHIGVLASLGVAQVDVFPRPRVGVVSTGDELVAITGPLAPGKIRDSNRPSLLARLRADGFQAVDLGWAGDEPGALAHTLVQAAQACDAVLTSGGVSVGDRDIVRVVLEELGGQQARWWQVAVRPGKPFAFSTFPPRSTPVFGLPGNPVSALVSYELFARPALRLMAGQRSLERPRLPAVAASDMRRHPDGRLHLVRVTVKTGPAGLEARPSGGQGSHQLRALAAANALAFLPDGEGVAAGEPLEVWVLDPDGLSP
ncbi:MAG: gephyrin-like molybdotransferase Glp [Acidimicrobiales bacterium]